MVNSFESPGDYRIEVSGWGLDNTFFVERTDLLWTAQGEKQVRLHRSLPERAVVFVRLLAHESVNGTVPVAYQVADVAPMDCNGRCEMRLTQLHPRSKESLSQKSASNGLGDSQTAGGVQEAVREPQPEEILQ
jgi:hypothetical protein